MFISPGREGIYSSMPHASFLNLGWNALKRPLFLGLGASHLLPAAHILGQACSFHSIRVHSGPVGLRVACRPVCLSLELVTVICVALLHHACHDAGASYLVTLCFKHKCLICGPRTNILAQAGWLPCADHASRPLDTQVRRDTQR